MHELQHLTGIWLLLLLSCFRLGMVHLPLRASLPNDTLLAGVLILPGCEGFDWSCNDCKE